MKGNLKFKDYSLVIILLLLVLVALFLFNFKTKTNLPEEVNKNHIKLLNDYSRFFTVNSCIIRYINYLENKESENILKVLNKEYLTNNDINLNNLYDYVDKFDGNYSFISKKIYYEKIDERYIKYYVYGNLLEDTIDGEIIKDNKFYAVILDTEEQTFNIAPYNGDIFMGEL